MLYLSIDGELRDLDPITGATNLIGPTPSASGLEVFPARLFPVTTVVSTIPPVGLSLLIGLMMKVGVRGARGF